MLRWEQRNLTFCTKEWTWSMPPICLFDYWSNACSVFLRKCTVCFLFSFIYFTQTLHFCHDLLTLKFVKPPYLHSVFGIKTEIFVLLFLFTTVVVDCGLLSGFKRTQKHNQITPRDCLFQVFWRHMNGFGKMKINRLMKVLTCFSSLCLRMYSNIAFHSSPCYRCCYALFKNKCQRRCVSTENAHGERGTGQDLHQIMDNILVYFH